VAWQHAAKESLMVSPPKGKRVKILCTSTQAVKDGSPSKRLHDLGGDAN